MGGQQQPWERSQTDFGSRAHGGAESPRTAAWRKAMLSAAPNAQLDVDDWAAKRTAALAAGPAHRAKSGAAMRAAQPEEEDDKPSGPVVPWEKVAQVFADDRPWADITDENDDKTCEELQAVMKKEEERYHLQKEAERKEDEALAEQARLAMEKMKQSFQRVEAPTAATKTEVPASPKSPASPASPAKPPAVASP